MLRSDVYMKALVLVLCQGFGNVKNKRLND